MSVVKRKSLVAALPSSVGLTHLRVYDTIAPDGRPGGSAHVHFACTECYYIVSGHGRVQTLSVGSGFEETDLAPGDVVWFTPGVIHRLINLDGALEIFVVMQNSGLPEAGDFVLTMPHEILIDPDSYFAAASLSAHGEVFARSIEGAYRRRDLAVQGFIELCDSYAIEGPKPLESFYQSATELIRPKIDSWEQVWRDGPLESANETGDVLNAIRAGDTQHLFNGTLNKMPAPSGDRRLGMCGTLGVYLPEGKTVASIDRNAYCPHPQKWPAGH